MNTTPSSSLADFETNLLIFLNQVLPGLDRRGRSYPWIESTTLLFETGIVDSLSILHLIAFIEDQIGRSIPDQMIIPPNFSSPNAIVQAFWSFLANENLANQNRISITN